MSPHRPHRTPQPSYIYHCPTVTCYYWNAGHCTYPDTACSYAHCYTGNLGPRHPNKSRTCLYWIENGECAAGEDGCQFAHFWTGRVAERRDYDRGNFARVSMSALRRGGDGSAGVAVGAESVEGAEVSLLESGREQGGGGSTTRGRWTKANWRVVDWESGASEGAIGMSIGDSDVAGNESVTSLGSTDMSISDSSTHEASPISPETHTTKHLSTWPPSSWYAAEPFRQRRDFSADPSTSGNSRHRSSEVDEEGADPGERVFGGECDVRFATVWCALWVIGGEV